ncbi:MAG TPA: hypothetical protein VJV79_34820 [Polyangiaceae bacterium]|nr:hypothetical protein [Polyangiaceae bacterium]
MNQVELAHPSRRPRARRPAAETKQRRIPSRSDAINARVSVAWTSSEGTGTPGLAPTEIELVAGLAPNRAWTCPQNFGSNWVEAIASAHCNEVVLTARLGDNLAAKHLVLELAELLTFKLTESHPLIRVRFLPTATRGQQSHA